MLCLPYAGFFFKPLPLVITIVLRCDKTPMNDSVCRRNLPSPNKGSPMMDMLKAEFDKGRTNISVGEHAALVGKLCSAQPLTYVPCCILPIQSSTAWPTVGKKLSQDCSRYVHQDDPCNSPIVQVYPKDENCHGRSSADLAKEKKLWTVTMPHPERSGVCYTYRYLDRSISASAFMVKYERKIKLLASNVLII